LSSLKKNVLLHNIHADTGADVGVCCNRGVCVV